MSLRGTVLLLAVAFLASGCEREAAAVVKPVVRLVRDTTLSEPLALEFNRTLPHLEVQLADLAGVGSYATIDAVSRRQADFGFALADVAYFSHVAFEDRPIAGRSQIQGIAALQVTPVHLLARRGVDIRDVADLRNLRVATGTEYSQLMKLAELIFRAYGLDPDSVRSGTLATHATAAALDSSQIDAAFVTGYYPSPAAMAATRTGARLISIDGLPAERMRQAYPFVRTVRIPAHTYPGQDHEVRTLGLDRLLICRSDLDDRVVYDLTKQLLAALPRLASTLRTSLRLMDLDQASAMPIPLHTGAAQYYRERELSR